MRTSKSGKLAASVTFEPASPGSRRLRRHANQQVREAGGFRDMRTSKSGKPAASVTCEPASPGSRRLRRHANQQVREAGDFREMLISKSGKPATSATHFRLILFSLTTWNSPARSGCLKFRTEVREIR